MIDLHTHTLLSDGELLPSELVRRALVKGYKVIGLTDHVDSSNIDFLLPRIVKVSQNLTSHWPIKVIPGIEITHVPLEEIEELIRYGRDNGAGIVLVHGETTSEPVIPGTNKRAIECKADILAHPGILAKDDAELAKRYGIYIEITTRKNHLNANHHIKDVARDIGLKLILNTDAHSAEDLIDDAFARAFLKSLNFNREEIDRIFSNSKELVGRFLSR